MDYKAIPKNFFEWFGLKMGFIPEVLVDMIVPAVKLRAIESSINLDILKEIGSGKKTSGDIAHSLGLNEESLLYLLKILIAIGFIKKRGEKYSLTGTSRKIMGVNYKFKSENFIRISQHQRELLDNLEEVVKTGKCIGIYKNGNKSNQKKDELMTRGFLDISRRSSLLIKNYIPVKKNAKKILDIGGAHGFVGACICKDHPGMKSTVIDSAGVIKTGRKIAVEEGYSDLVEFISGNILTKKIGKEWDVVFGGNIFHVFTSEEISNLLKKLYEAISDDGTIAIFDISPSLKKKTDLLSDSFSLLFYLSSSSKCYSRDEYRNFLIQAGFKDVKIFNFLIAILVTARKR